MTFWREKTLEEMSDAEWESLCDGCGLCCQLRVEDVDTGEIALTQAVCRHLDLETHRCTDYANRRTNVPTCLKVTPRNVHELEWIPPTCAYKVLADGYDLPPWHPLVSGRADSVHVAGPSMRGEVVSEDEFDWSDYEDADACDDEPSSAS